MQLIRLSGEDPRGGARRLSSEDLRFLLRIGEAQLGTPQHTLFLPSLWASITAESTVVLRHSGKARRMKGAYFKTGRQASAKMPRGKMRPGSHAHSPPPHASLKSSSSPDV